MWLSENQGGSESLRVALNPNAQSFVPSFANQLDVLAKEFRPCEIPKPLPSESYHVPANQGNAQPYDFEAPQPRCAVPTSLPPPLPDFAHVPQPPPTASVPLVKPTPARDASPTDPVVVLLYGRRGSGKSTQAQILAERFHLLRLCSGDIFREKKDPIQELQRIVQEEFGQNGARRYNGLVLDRFIVKSEVDAYYIDSILSEANLPVPLVFWLRVDPSVGMERAATRGETKPALDFWRHVEQIAQEATSEKAYRPCGRLVEVDCNKLDKEASSQLIISELTKFIMSPNRNTAVLPPLSLMNTNVPLPLNVKYDVFEQLKKQIFTAVCGTAGRTDSPPLSTINGYVDTKFFKEARNNQRFVAHFMFVTLKVDGQRFLVVRHRERGFVGFPSTFNYCFDFNALFAGADLSFDTILDNPLDVILDTELQVDPQGKPMLHIIDFVYFHGHRGRSLTFFERYQMLNEWIPEPYHYPECLKNPQHFCLKQYVPINQLSSLLHRFEDAPFPVDGIIFQHNDVYRLGLDRYLLKWKPQELCTVDFRLADGKKSKDGKYWEFQLHVIDCAAKDSNYRGEVAFPDSIGIFTSEEVAKNDLCEGKVVEMLLHKEQGNRLAGRGSQPTQFTMWTFHRSREDKLAPNKLTTAEQIAKLSHLTYAELLHETKMVRYVQPLKILRFTDNEKNLSSATIKPINDVTN